MHFISALKYDDQFSFQSYSFQSYCVEMHSFSIISAHLLFSIYQYGWQYTHTVKCYTYVQLSDVYQYFANTVSKNLSLKHFECVFLCLYVFFRMHSNAYFSGLVERRYCIMVSLDRKWLSIQEMTQGLCISIVYLPISVGMQVNEKKLGTIHIFFGEKRKCCHTFQGFFIYT